VFEIVDDGLFDPDGLVMKTRTPGIYLFGRFNKIRLIRAGEKNFNDTKGLCTVYQCHMTQRCFENQIENHDPAIERKVR
jgi:hypothetical protein